MLNDLSKFEALWSEIRQSQYLTEEEIKKINKLIEELKELSSSNSSNIEALTKLYNITNKLILNIDAVNTNLKNNVTNLSDIAENYNEKIKDTIKNSVKWIDTSSIRNEIKNQLEVVKKDIANAISREKDELNKLSREFKSANLDLTFTKDEIKKNIEKLDETREKLNNKIKNINWKLIIGSGILCGLIGAIGGTLASQYVFFKYEKKTSNSNIELTKLKNEIKTLKNEISNKDKKIKEFKAKITELKKWEVPPEYQFNSNNKIFYIGIPATDIEYYKNKKYCFVKLFEKKDNKK